MHTFIAGPSGAGKSVLLGALAVQWKRYEGSRVIIFDKDRSARQLTYAVGGDYYEPGDGKVTFQPLVDLETAADVIWASEFVELLLDMQNMVIDSSIRKEIMDALKVMQTINVRERTISTFQQYVQNEIGRASCRERV